MDRAGLRPEVQEAYNRLVEQRKQAREPVPAAEREAGFRQAVPDARQVLEDGRRVCLVTAPSYHERPVDRDDASLSGPSPVIKAIEDPGWRLDQMS